jgi:hypothetical protein
MRDKLPAVLGVVVFGIAIALWVTQCSGPRPMLVGEPTVRAPDQPAEPYHVEAHIANEGPGHGEVRVMFRLENRATGQAYQKDEMLELDRGEDARVVVEINAPPADYEPRVEVEYPPR